MRTLSSYTAHDEQADDAVSRNPGIPFRGARREDGMVGNLREGRCLAIAAQAILLSLLFQLAGCENVSNYLGYMSRKSTLSNTFHDRPSLQVLRDLAPENCYSLDGTIEAENFFEEPVLVVAVSDRYQSREIVASRIVRAPALYYSIFLPEGDYDIYIFADLNKNGIFEQNELVGRTAPGKPVTVARGRAVDNILVNGPPIKLDLRRPATADIPVNAPVAVSGYRYDSLDNDFFDARWGTMGIYRPTEFLAHTQGAFFALDEYDPDKTMVLFVHGVEGTPQDWKYLVEGLDRKRFQPWFYFYASGLPLDKLGSILGGSIEVFDELREYRLKRLVIVAHSMGGLVARSAIDKVCRNGKPPYLKMYISLSSPYGGVEDANEGIKTAPVVVPSWRDVATESLFLQNIYQRDLPPDVPFHMFFGYRNKSGVSSDGTITLRSQLDYRVHLKAVKTYGFDVTHVGILNDEAVRKEFYRLLDTVAPRERSAGNPGGAK